MTREGDAATEPMAHSGDRTHHLANRRSPAPDNLVAPGPTREQIDRMFAIATRVPDHGRLQPWRLIAIRGEAKARWLEALAALAERREDAPKARVSLRKLSSAPLVVAVVSRPTAGHKVPEWEQLLSTGAVAMNLLHAAEALGFGGNWLTGWHAYDPEARALLGLSEAERIAGIVPIGTVVTATPDRERPALDQIVTWLA